MKRLLVLISLSMTTLHASWLWPEKKKIAPTPQDQFSSSKNHSEKTNKNSQAAKELLEQVANQQDDPNSQVSAQFELGCMYFESNVIDKARRYLNLAINQTVNSYIKTVAMIKLGILERNEKNYSTAKKYLEIVANQHDDLELRNLALYHIGITNYIEKEYGSSKKYFDKIINESTDTSTRALAQNELAIMYFTGEGQEKNYDTAKEYFEKAASQDQNISAKAYAQWHLGLIYFEGFGVSKNSETAKKYFEQAAAQNIDLCIKAKALFELGRLYYTTSSNNVQNYTIAEGYLLQSLDQEQLPAESKAWAQFYLGELYLVTAEKRDEAQKYLEQAAEQQDPIVSSFANFKLGTIYNDGTTQNTIKAIKYFKAVIDKNIIPEITALAQYFLAEIYWIGKAVPKNIALAKQYLEPVCKQSFNSVARTKAQFLLGIILREN